MIKTWLIGDKGKYTKHVIVFWILYVLLILCFIGAMYSIAHGSLGELPTTEKFENPRHNLASDIISSDGEVIGKYFLENRKNINYNDLSPELVKTLVATEDVRYYDHSGIDFRGLMRAIVRMGKDGGASTISQQTAKNLFPRVKFETKKEKIARKLKEQVMACRLERLYTKEEILALYFNTVAFDGNSFGINSASQNFFKKSPKELDYPEAAVLVGMLKATSKFHPKLNPENAVYRRNTVYGQLKKYHVIDETAYDSLKEKPIFLDYSLASNNDGIAQHFREQLRIELHDWCDENGYDLYTDGLKIYVTLDSRMQKHAENAVWKHLSEHQERFYKHWEGREPWAHVPEIITMGMKRSERYRMMKADNATETEIEKAFNTPVRMKVFSYSGTKDTTMTPLDSIKYYKMFLQTGFMSMEPSTGYIKAWVGGLDQRFFKYDHVNTNAKRQVGSTFKTFVYALAMDNNSVPCDKCPNVPVKFEEYDNWSPGNDGLKDGGEMTLYEGLAKSVNNCVAYLMKRLGPQNVIDLVRKMGVVNDLQPYPSICLGSMDLSVYEMVGAYNVFANQGVYVKPSYLLKIEDKNGNVLYDNTPETREAMSAKTAYLMVKMLDQVTRGWGTATRLRYRYNFTGEMGGKTGTTQNQSDGWFMGITPNLVSGGWVGNEDRAVHFRSIRLGGGSDMALPIWAYYMQSVYDDKSLNYTQEAKFKVPDIDLEDAINCKVYQDKGSDNLTNPLRD